MFVVSRGWLCKRLYSIGEGLLVFVVSRGWLCKRHYSVGEVLLVFVVRGGGVKDSIVMGRGCWCLW